MTIDPPWRLDPFQNIIDVRWGSEIAALTYRSDGPYVIPSGGGFTVDMDIPRIVFLAAVTDPVTGKPKLTLSSDQLGFPAVSGFTQSFSISQTNLGSFFGNYFADFFQEETTNIWHAAYYGPNGVNIGNNNNSPIAIGPIPQYVPKPSGTPPGTKVFADSLGTIFETQTTTKKYSFDSGSSTWALVWDAGLFVSGDSVIIDAPNNSIKLPFAGGSATYSILDGSFVSEIDISPFDRGATDAGGNSYGFPQHFSNTFSKYDTFGHVVWTTTLSYSPSPAAYDSGFNNLLNFSGVGLLFAVNVVILGNLIITLGFNSVAPVEGDTGAPTDFYLLAYSTVDGSLVSQKRLGQQRVNRDNLGNRTLSFCHVDNLAKSQRFPPVADLP